MANRFQDKVALVTGASSGFGAATARAFAREGAKVVLAARSEEKLRRVAKDIEAAGGAVLVVPTDVTKREEVAALVEKALAAYGRVDIAVNNAGEGLFKTIDETTEEAFRKLIELNLMGAFHVTKAVAPVMRRQKGGQIVNVSSVAGKRAYNRTSAYSATKFGLIGFSQGVRWDVHKDGVEVIVVCPPASATNFFNASNYGDAGERGHAKYVEDHPKDALWTAEAVAAEILDACATHKQEVVMGLRFKLFTILYAIFPNLFDLLKKKIKGK